MEFQNFIQNYFKNEQSLISITIMESLSDEMHLDKYKHAQAFCLVFEIFDDFDNNFKTDLLHDQKNNPNGRFL